MQSDSVSHQRAPGGALPDDAPVELIAEARDLDAELDFYLGVAGFRLDAVFPADDPATALISRRGLRVRLRRGDSDRPLRLHVASTAASPAVLRSPGGTVVEIGPGDDALVVPDNEQSLVVTRAGGTAGPAWVTGRAGMRYRDLLPGRWGGRFIASHIHLADGGPVPDYVHYHLVRFQLIVVKAGWVEVVYEDQGPPFVMGPGDAVLQPPEIRHRVLHSSAGAEVVEIGCPAEHVTLVDHDLELPTARSAPDRDFGGQRFARSVFAPPQAPWRIPGYRAHDTGFGPATGGLVGARLVAPGDRPSTAEVGLDTEFSMLVVLAGQVDLEHDGGAVPALAAGDSVALPSGAGLRLRRPSPDLLLLDVTLPA